MKLVAPAPAPDEIDALIRLATRAPDHGKLSPWRFVILEGAAKSRFAQDLEAMATGRGDMVAVAKLGKLKAPPLAIVVISSPKPAKVPEWEQRLSAGAVCTNLLYSALAMGYGANWITDWYSYDEQACAHLGLAGAERVAGFIFIGTASEPALERERPQPGTLVSHWQP